MADDWFAQFAPAAPSSAGVLSMSAKPAGWRAADEQLFQKWYATAIKGRELDPNPDAPEHHYNYRAAFKAGAWPGQDGHWPSEFKDATHPNRFVDGVDTITGQPQAKPAEDDFFAQFEPAKAPAGAAPAKAPSWLDSVGTFLDRATKPFQPGEINRTVQAVNPLEMAGPQSFGEVARDEGILGALAKYKPVAAVGNILKGQGKLAEDAQKDFEKGDYGAGVVKALHYLVPMIGPQLQHAGEEVQRGELAAGLGDTAAIASGVVGPAVAGRAAGAINRALPAGRVGGLNALTPAEAEAIAFGKTNQVPIDAATATGNSFVKGAQSMAEKGTLSGSIVGDRARAAQGSSLATLGEQLAAKGYPTATTAEAAGEGLDTAIRGVARQHGADASYAYKTLAAHEADPANARTFEIARNPDPVTGAPQAVAANFAPRNAPAGAVFDGVYADAVKQGWKGTKKELRAEFEARVAQAKDLGGELGAAADDFSNEALLREVRKIGLRPSLKEGAGGTTVRGDFAPLVDTFRTGKWKQNGAASVFRKDGRPLDELVQLLNQDPRFADLTDQGLMTRLGDIAAAGPSKPKLDLEGLLGAVDVKPGSRWWDRSAVAADQAIAGDVGAVLDGRHLVRTETVPLGVDLRASKQGLQPLYERLKREAELVPLQGHKAAALTSLDRLMTAPDVAPLSVVDGALGELKAALRSGKRGGEFLSEGQAGTAQVVGSLDDAVKAAAGEAGSHVLDALLEGRASTIAKYDALDVLDLLKGEPVKTIEALTAAKDGGIGKLREVARVAPGEMPKIGRAWLDGQLAKATEAGGFSHADRLYADWQKLGSSTKSVIFRDAGYVKDLDNFFLLGKKLAENPNPSGTARAVAAGAHVSTAAAGVATGNLPLLLGSAASELTGGVVSKFLRSRRGVQLLTQGMRLQVSPKLATGAAGAKVAADLARFAGPDWSRSPVFADEDGRRQP